MNNPAAFPQPLVNNDGRVDAAADYGHEGMSLRDWFAGLALQGLATNQETLLSNQDLMAHFGTDGIDKLQANKAFRLADAMLAERERKTP